MANAELDKMVRDLRLAQGLSPEPSIEEQAAYSYEAQKAQFDEIKSRGIGPSCTPVELKKAANVFLIDSARAGNADGIKAALAAGANPNVREAKDGTRHNQEVGATPLMTACWAGPDAIDGVKALIEAGADVNAKTPTGQNAIISAASGCARYDHYHKNAEPLIDALVAAGAKPDDGFHNGKTPLFACVNEYDAAISTSAIKALLKHGANPNAVTNDGQGDILNHVLWSAQQGDKIGVDAVKALVEAGAVIDKDKEISPLVLVANGSGLNALELTKYLLEKGANPDVVDSKGKHVVDIAKEKLAYYNEQGWQEAAKKEGKVELVEVLESALQKPDLSAAKEGDAASRENQPPEAQRAQG